MTWFSVMVEMRGWAIAGPVKPMDSRLLKSLVPRLVGFIWPMGAHDQSKVVVMMPRPTLLEYEVYLAWLIRRQHCHLRRLSP